MPDTAANAAPAVPGSSRRLLVLVGGRHWPTIRPLGGYGADSAACPTRRACRDRCRWRHPALIQPRASSRPPLTGVVPIPATLPHWAVLRTTRVSPWAG